MLRRALLSLTLGPLALGCFVDRASDEVASTTDASTTDGSSSGSTSLLTSTTATTGEATTSTGPTTDTASEGDTTGAPGPLDEPCTAYCAHQGRCGSGQERTCLALCAPLLTVDPNPSEACITSARHLLECLTAATCEALMSPKTACPDDYAAQQSECTPCEATVEPAMGEACSARLTCQVDVYEAVCGPTQCSCMVNGREVQLCSPGADYCAGTDDERIANARACCDWPA
ncbi:MAG: hypothetical protein R3B09_17230 [Nannocystaceae bacterium]